MPTRGRPRQLDEGAVARTALELLDAGGAGALSVRGVAGRLGVAPNAVYTYVADREALHRAVAELVLAEADVALLDGPAEQWRQRVQSYAEALRRVLLAHPGAALLLMAAPMDGPTALEVGEGLLRALVDAGASTGQAARGAYAVIVHVLGSAALEVADVERAGPLPPEGERVAARRERFAAVPDTAFPLTAGSRDVAAAWVSTEQFRWGLRAVLDAVGPPVSSPSGP